MSNPPVRLEADLRRRLGTLDLHVQLAVGTGQILGVLGPNGAGKTTVLRLLAGLDRPDAGHVTLGNGAAPRVLTDAANGVHLSPRQRNVGVVFQDGRLFADLTVLDNVAFGLRARGARRRPARAAATAWLTRFGLADLAEARPSSLSGGQAQRVALARALITTPRLLLLDEPFAALDAGRRSDLRSDLPHLLADHPGPTVLVTHDPLDALVLADSLLVLEAGRVVQSGPPDAVARRPATPFVARLMGLTLVRGIAHDGVVALDDGGTLTIADRALRGPVFVSIRPSSVALHATAPEGSPRNVWSAVVTGLEPVGDRVRVALAPRNFGGHHLLADVTPAATAQLRLAPGTTAWASVKAVDLEAYRMS